MAHFFIKYRKRMIRRNCSLFRKLFEENCLFDFLVLFKYSHVLERLLLQLIQFLPTYRDIYLRDMNLHFTLLQRLLFSIGVILVFDKFLLLMWFLHFIKDVKCCFNKQITIASHVMEKIERRIYRESFIHRYSRINSS